MAPKSDSPRETFGGRADGRSCNSAKKAQEASAQSFSSIVKLEDGKTEEGRMPPPPPPREFARMVSYGGEAEEERIREGGAYALFKCFLPFLFGRKAPPL